MKLFNLDPELIKQPSIRAYSLVCLAAVPVYGMALLERGAELGAVIPMLIGLAGALVRWRSAPLLLLLALAFVHVLTRPVFWWQRIEAAHFDATDLLECAAVIGYVMAHYRLQTLVHHAVPPDGRRPKVPGTAQAGADTTQASRLPSYRRSPHLAAGPEVVQMLISIPIWVSLAVVVWLALPGDRNALGLVGHMYRLLVLIWLLGMGGLVTAALLGYLRWRRLGQGEARQFLQDVLWLETRREQGLINRWLAETKHKEPR